MFSNHYIGTQKFKNVPEPAYGLLAIRFVIFSTENYDNLIHVGDPDVNFFNHFLAIFPCKTPKTPTFFDHNDDSENIILNDFDCICMMNLIAKKPYAGSGTFLNFLCPNVVI